MDLTGSQEQTAPPPFAVASHKAIPAGIFLQRHPSQQTLHANSTEILREIWGSNCRASRSDFTTYIIGTQLELAKSIHQ